MREILDTVDSWTGDGLRVATATLVRTERSAPREVGSVMAVSERGDVAGSLTGGCVEPAIYEEAREVLAGGSARLRTYGIEDEEAFEAGLPCGGTVHVFVNTIERELVRELSVAVRAEASVALAMQVSGPATG